MKSVRPIVQRAAAAALFLLLAACETPAPPQFPDFTFDHKPPIRLDVADIQFVAEYVPPQTPPNVEHLFPVRPSAAVRRWVADRLQAGGVTRTARVTLVEAGAIETALKTKQGIVGVFTKDQSERYDMTVIVRVEIVNDRGQTEGHAQAVVNRSRTVPEGITINDRDVVWYQMTGDVMQALDAELEQTIRNYLVRFLR